MRCSKLFYPMALLAALAACADAPTTPAVNGMAPPTAQPRRSMNPTTSRVVGYLPRDYAGSLDSIRFNKLTHVNYAFTIPRTNGTIDSLIAMSGDTRLTQVVQKAHVVGTKVLISIGGWSGSSNSTFEPMAANATSRAAFVSNVVTFVNNYGLDGVDIDWEYPESGTEATNYAALMAALDTAMHSRGKLLTAAVTAKYYGAGVQSSVFSNVDYLILMAYDGGFPHSPYSYAVESLDYWSGRGLPQSKTVLGVPFYGTEESGDFQVYRIIVRDDAGAPARDSSRMWRYNGLATMRQKTALSLQRASGVGIWEITMDTTLASISLLSAIHDEMNSSKVVYDDALGSGWANWSWSTTLNFANTTPAYVGTRSISATYTAAWAALYMHHGSGISTTGLGRLEFYVHGGSAGGQNLIVQAGDTGGWRTLVPVNSYIAGSSVAAGSWRKVSIPMSALGLGTLAITDLVIQENTGGAQPTVYVDHIQFTP